MSIIELKNISKQYIVGANTLKVIDNFNETLKSGELVAIVGASGAGKSTLMHIIGGLDRPTSGSVLIDGIDIYNGKDNQLNQYRKDTIGFVFQDYLLLDDFTALENITLPSLVAGKNPKTAKDAATELIKLVDMEDRQGHYPSELSGGEQQRIAVARALINNPKFILADEPTGNLDKNNSTVIFNLLSSLTKKGIGVVIVTHDEVLASKCDRIIKLQKL